SSEATGSSLRCQSAGGRAMHQLSLAARPPAPQSQCSRSRTACRCSLKQAPASLAVAARRCAAAPLLAASLLLAAAAASPGIPAGTPPAFAQSQGAALFRKACIGCHDTGGNILQPGATLSMKDLERERSCHGGRDIQHHLLREGKDAGLWRAMHAERAVYLRPPAA
uniref:Cytochrome c-553 n=1 Tax=Aegilops tauschii subsp. strangulata TaxID=200361 RepID=A0A453BA15_AEGTS